MNSRHVASPLAALLFLLACMGLAPEAEAQLSVVDAFPGVSFTTPVELVVAPGQPTRAYIVEQGRGGNARIMTLEVGDTSATVFLDIDSRVRSSGQEQGLLGLAFHPDYDTNGRFFVHFTGQPDGRTVVSEFSRDAANPLTADPASEQILLEIDQPFSNHNAGKIAFGPDGYLYIAAGDGGSGGDPQNNGQRLSTLLGSLLRIDVDDIPAGATYGIPNDNPFVGTSGARGEIYAYGLRNTWKFSFDSETGDLWAADVGQNEWEEINIVEAGGNYGWRPVEGPECFVSGCDLSAYDAPVFSYPHSSVGTQGGFSISGGIVYRGTQVAGLTGRYLFADFVLPRLWMLNADAASGAATATIITTGLGNIAGINEGPGREAYVVTYGGTIYTIQGAIVSTEDEAPEAQAIRLDGPNPVSDETTVVLTASGGEPARVAVVDVLGRELALLHYGPTPSGDLALALDARGLASGVVLIVLDSPSRRAILPLTIAR